MSLDSDWHDGLLWMKIDTGYVPVIRYDQLKTEKATKYEVQKERFDEPFQLSANLSIHKVGLETQVGYSETGRQSVELLLGSSILYCYL